MTYATAVKHYTKHTRWPRPDRTQRRVEISLQTNTNKGTVAKTAPRHLNEAEMHPRKKKSRACKEECRQMHKLTRTNTC